MKAAANPIIIAPSEMSEAPEAEPLRMSIPSSSASPRIGGITIRNENCASFSLLSPSRSPVAMVEPERDRPGSTATACAKPMTNASAMEISCLTRGL